MLEPAVITIRRCETPAEYRAVQDAQRRAWGITEDGYIVPVATMVGAQLHGGLVLGAFTPEGEAVGLSFAFLGRIEGRLGLYSQLTGVVPGYQGHGLGERLKHAQRDIAREEGLAVIAWAFDPLQAGNAHFNLARLGATVRRFVDDMYGPRTDTLNANVPTDRLIAEWETTDAARPPAVDGSPLARPHLIETRPGPGDRPVPVALAPTLEAPAVLLEIPDRIAELRRSEPDQAERWRQLVSEGFHRAFAAGYRAAGFVRSDGPAGRRGFYVLERPAIAG